MQLSLKWNCIAGDIARTTTTSTQPISNSEVSCYPKATCFCLARQGFDAESLAMHPCVMHLQVAVIFMSNIIPHKLTYLPVFASVLCVSDCFLPSVSPTGAHNFNLQRRFRHMYCCLNTLHQSAALYGFRLFSRKSTM